MTTRMRFAATFTAILVAATLSTACKPGSSSGSTMKMGEISGSATATAEPGMGNMAAQQVKNVLFHAVVSLFVAYIAAVTLAPGTEYLRVFQVTGTAAFLAYGFAWGHQVIWFGRPFKVAMKELCDGLVMALFTAGIFGWRWPGM